MLGKGVTVFSAVHMTVVSWNYDLVIIFIWRLNMVERDALGYKLKRGGLVMVILCVNLTDHKMPRFNIISECVCKVFLMRLAFELVDPVKQMALPSVGGHHIQSIKGLNRTKDGGRESHPFSFQPHLVELGHLI